MSPPDLSYDQEGERKRRAKTINWIGKKKRCTYYICVVYISSMETYTYTRTHTKNKNAVRTRQESNSRSRLHKRLTDSLLTC